MEKADDDNICGLYMKGIALLKKGEYEQAISAFKSFRDKP